MVDPNGEPSNPPSDPNVLPTEHSRNSNRLSLTPVTLAFTLLFGILLGTGGLFAYQEYIASPAVGTYVECVREPGSRMQERYPAMCITRDGRQFTQPIPEEEGPGINPTGADTLPRGEYTCPNTEWVDCMPGPDAAGIRLECTQEYLQWAKESCPGFQGAAY